MLRAKPRTLLTIVILASIVTLGAQDQKPPDTPSLAALKSEFETSMREAMAPRSQQYVAELRKLETKFAAAGDFEAAIKARDERKALEKFLGDAILKPLVASTTGKDVSGNETTAGTSGLDFQDTAANVSNGAAFKSDGLDLSARGATASWKLGNVEPGGYEIELHYSASAEVAVQVKESFFRLSADVPTTGGEQSKVLLGTLKITADSETLALVHTSGSDTKLIVHSIQLTSAKQ